MRSARKQLKQAVITAAAMASLSSMAFATDYTWVNFAGGTYLWTDAGNWNPVGVPNANTDSANLSGAVTGSNLIVNLPSDVSVATLTMGATGSPFTTNIGSTGGTLIWDAGAATFLVNSVGASGSQNVISAPVLLGAGTTSTLRFRVAGTNDINLSGGVTMFTDNVGTASMTRVLSNSAGAYSTGTATSGTLTLNLGTLVLGTMTLGPIQLSQAGALQNGSLLISGVGTNSTGATDPLPTPNYTWVDGGTIVFNGVISNGAFSGGRLTLGGNATSGFTSTATTFVMNTSNTHTGNTTLGKGRFLLNAQDAFGTGGGAVNQNSAANTFTIQIESNSDARSIDRIIQLQQHMTFAGNNSLALNGYIHQSNGRSMVNNIAAGKQLTINGFVAPVTTGDTARNITFDGSGLTVINGPIYNHRKPWGGGTLGDASDELVSTGGIIKRGAGTLLLDPTVFPVLNLTGGGTINGPTSTYRGPTGILGGLVEFTSPAAYGKLDSFTANIDGFGDLTITNNPGTSLIYVTAGGAVGVRTGSLDAEFLGKLNAGTIFNGNSGAIALSSADAAAAVDFTSGPLAQANLLNMSIGALSGGVTFTGTITPNPVAGYRLGGGGKLTLANNNQLTGARNVTVTNGGEVAVSGTQNYTGVTTIRGDYLLTDTKTGSSTASGTNNFGFSPYAIRADGMLSVNVLADGGTASGVGASTSAASNLVIQGGTLKYTGSGGSTNRLFTMNPVGATLDASGTGAVNFTNTGAIVQTDAAPRIGNVQTGGNARIIAALEDVSDLAPGMVVTADLAGVGTYLQASTRITGLNVALSGQGTLTGNIAIDQNAAAGATGATLTFTEQNRNLNLTGTNTGNNTFAPQLVDSAAGRVGVNKSGSGTWVLTNGNHTYTGGTTVNGGVLATVKVRNNGPTTITGGTLKTANGLTVADPAGTSVFPEGQFTIAGGASPAGKLDLSKGGAVFEYSTVSVASTVSALLDSGYGSGNWDGNGIVSSDAAASPSTHAVGWAESSALGSPATFLGQAVDSTSVLVRYTRQGDANLDGTTGLADFSLVGANYNQPGTWNTGDFNYDGLTGLGDFSLLAANYNQSAGSGVSGRPGAVPEPATLGLLAAAAILGLRRRSR